MAHSRRPGDLLGGRYRLVDLLAESAGGRFWRAHDRVLARHVAVHVIAADDPRAPALLEAARASAGVHDPRVLRVLDADRDDAQVWVVNEWGSGTSLDLALADGPLGARRAAHVVAETAEAVAVAHAAGIAHGRLVPENVLLDHTGQVRLIGLAVDAALHGLPPGRPSDDLVDLGGLLYAGLTGRWAGATRSAVEAAPRDGDGGRVLRPRQVRAGIPRVLDQLCDALVNEGDPTATGGLPALALAATGAGQLRGRDGRPPASARELADVLHDVVGDPTGLAASLATVAGPAARGGGPAVPPDTPAGGTPRERSGAGEPPLPAGPVSTGTLPAGPFSPLAGSPTGTTTATTPATTPVPTVPPAATGPAAGPDPTPHPGPDPDGPDDDATRVVPVAPADPSSGRPGPADERADGPHQPEQPDAEPHSEPDADRTDLPTEAGVPIFHDGSDDVEWLRKRSVEPPPPPPFEELPERPLFAPDPAPGEPLRRARPGATAATGAGGDFWPWADTGTGQPASPPPVDDDPEEGGPVPGRRTLRVALLLALVLLTALAVVAAFDLGRGGSPLGGDEPEDPAPSASEAPLRVVEGIVASDLDPQGDPPEENPDLAPLAVDGDPATTWRTSTYDQQLGPAGLKTGVGLVLDLGRSLAPREVAVTTAGGRTGLSLYLADEPPSSVADLRPVAELSGVGGATATLDGSASGRYLVVWLTSLPEADGGFRGEVAEVRVSR